MKAFRVYAVLLLLSAAGAHAEEESPRALIQRALDSLPNTTVKTSVELSSSRGWSRSLEIMGKRIDDAMASFIEVTGPQDVKDTRFLFFERINSPDEQHMYIPLIKRAIQIADETRKQAFLGSDFYISDLVAPELDSYEYKYVGEDELLGRKCKLVEAIPKRPENELYSKTIGCVDTTDMIVLRTQLFDKKGELLKVSTIRKLEKIDGIWTAMEQEMENVQEKTTSTISITSIQYHVELPDDVFTRARLLR